VSTINRRSFLKNATAAAAAIPFRAMLARAEAPPQIGGGALLRSPGYGPLVDAIDETTGLPLLKLPEGFRYLTFGWAGDRMADGCVTPGKHDGMGAFAAGAGRVRLIRNHETDKGAAFCAAAYDPDAHGGTTTL
jgi:secreted PhoX family phosphatase